MAYEAELFNVDPYYDDYDADKKFLRMMFRPGYAVQARELTQLQTLLQTQIQRFGDHIFEDGSIVFNGQVNENYLRYARVTGIAGTTNIADFIGTDIQAGDTIARVVHAELGLTSSDTDNYPVLFFEYLNGGTAFAAGDVLSATSSADVALAVTITGATTGTQLAVGEGLLVSVNEGIRYVEGYFVVNDAQKIGAYELTGASGSEIRVFDSPTTRMGFNVQKTFVTADDDDTLNDPAFGYYNYAAPGSDRFKINLPVIQYPFDPTDTSTVDNFSRENFIEFIRVQDGVTIKKERYPDYAVLEDTLARRTYDESGHYHIDPFDLSVSGRGLSSDKLGYILDPGKAYVHGYEFETQAPTRLVVDRARTTAIQTNQAVVSGFGQYLKTEINNGMTAAWSAFDLNTEPRIIFSGVVSGATAAIGSGRLRDLVYQTDGTVRAYVYGLNFITPFSLTHADNIFLKGFNTDAEEYLLSITGTPQLLGRRSSGLIFPVPVGKAVKEITSVDYATTRAFSNVAFVHSGGTTAAATINLSSELAFGASAHTLFPNWTTPQGFPDEDIIVIGMTGQVYDGEVTSISGRKSLFIVVNDVAAGFTAHVVTAIEMDYDTDYYRRTKTKVTESINLTGATAQFRTDPFNKRPYLMVNGLVDVQTILSITGTSGGVTNTNLTTSFYLDGRQTDEVYLQSRLYLNAGLTTTNYTGPYDVTLTRYDHSGDFGPFTVDSYEDYEDIPTHTSRVTGVRYNLRDCLDFRPTIQLDKSVEGHGPPSNTNVNDNEFGYEHYLGRIDRILLNGNKQFSVVEGVPAVNPVPPAYVPEAMNLHLVNLDAYTFTASDVSTRMLENRRYTMRDLDDFGRRLTEIERWIILHTLEHDALNTTILDDQGVPMPVLGVLVDQFYGHAVGDVEDPAHNCSVDYTTGELRPPFNNRVFEAGTGLASGATFTSDGIAMLNIASTSTEIYQPQKTRSVLMNTAGVISWQGYMKCSPPGSIWFDDTTPPYVRNNIEGENDGWVRSERQEQGFGIHWLDWENHWFGRMGDVSSHSYVFGNEDDRSIPVLSGEIDFGTIRTGTNPNDQTNSEENETVNMSVVPYMKETDIEISAYGLKPFTQMYVFFDDDNFSPTGTNALDYTYVSGGSTKATAINLRTNALGVLTGIYIKVPVGQYLTGKKKIRLTDSPSNTVGNTTTAADFLFAAHGRQITTVADMALTRYPIVKRESVRTENIVTTLNEASGTNAGEISLVGLGDPMSQVFWVDQTRFPGGTYIKSVKIWLSKNGETNGFLPVTLQLKPTIQDQYPHPSLVFPFGEVVKHVQDIPDNGTPVTFEFTTPLWLTSGGVYSISLHTNSTKVTVDTAVVGELLAGQNGERATRPPYMGGFYRMKSGSNFERSFNEMMRFELVSCKFASSGEIDLEGLTGTDYAASFIPHHYYTKVLRRQPVTTDLTFKEEGVMSPSGFVSIPNTTLLTRPASSSVNNNFGFSTIRATMSRGSNEYTSPFVDITRSAIVTVENEVTPIGLTAQESLSSPTSDNARYITRKVILDEGLEARNLQVRMSLCNYIDNRSAGRICEVQVWTKYFAAPALAEEFDDYVEASLEDATYEQLTAESEPVSVNGNDFREHVFNLRPTMTDGDPTFGAFAVKIVLLSSDGRFVPKVKNLRIIAV